MTDHNNLEELADPVNYDLEQNHERGIPFYAALAEETGGGSKLLRHPLRR